jgi:hypothetical protein
MRSSTATHLQEQANSHADGKALVQGMNEVVADPVVVCGFSMRFPQDASSPEDLWNLMMSKRCATTEFPPNRLNVNGFYTKSNRMNTVAQPFPRTCMFDTQLMLTRCR